MVDQLTLQTVGILLTGLTVSIAAIYYMLTLRYTRKNQQLQLETRKLQLYSQNVQTTRTVDWMQALINLLLLQELDDFDDFMSKYGPETNLQGYASFFTVLEAYQTMGVFLEEEAVDIEMIYRHNGEIPIRVWEKVEPFVRELRIRRDSPHMYRSFEKFYNELKKYEEQHPDLK